MARQFLFSLLGGAAVSLMVPMRTLGDESLPGRASEEAAQTGKASSDAPTAVKLRPLSAREGRALIRKIAWAEDEEGLAPDCSHLVHLLYERAGHPYPYASSTDLYRGAAHFLRVRAPQPGDLIVWPGHVGIVVNPVEHSFFSSVSTGAQTRDYTSPYWRARGHARFYRYLTNPRGEKTGKAGIADVRQQAKP